MDLDAILTALCAHVPEAIGAVLADADGESIATVRGAAPLPTGAAVEARRHLPRALVTSVDLDVFALRLGGAEPSPILRHLDRHARAYEVRYRDVDALVHVVGEELYVVLFLRRPAVRTRARVLLSRAATALAAVT